MSVMAMAPRQVTCPPRSRKTDGNKRTCLSCLWRDGRKSRRCRRIAIAMLGVRRTSICPSARFRRILSPAILAAFHSGSPLSPAQDGEGIENDGRGRTHHTDQRKEGSEIVFHPPKVSFWFWCGVSDRPFSDPASLHSSSPQSKDEKRALARHFNEEYGLTFG